MRLYGRHRNRTGGDSAMLKDTKHDERLDRLIAPDALEGLYAAALWAASEKRGIPPDKAGPSIRLEALQKLYRAAYVRGRREALEKMADDGK